MSQTLKDRAWKLFELAFYIGLAVLVLNDWKGFVAWLVHFVAYFIAGVIFWILLVLLLDRN